MPRYAAKLLFIWNPDPVTGSRHRRLCEERIVVFRSRSARDAVRKAKTIGRSEQLHFESGHRLRFAGVLQCMDLPREGPSEVWWEFQRRSNPEQWARKAVPPPSGLYVFTDHAGKGKPANNQMQRSAPGKSERRR
jgi:hypothetical protein